MELDILTTMDFRVIAPSAYRFLQRFRRLSIVNHEEEVFFYAQYLQEIAMLDATLLRFRPSQLAGAALVLSAKQLKNIQVWNEDMAKYTGYTEGDLKEAADEIKCFAQEINPKFISTLKYKFSKPEYHNVARLAFTF